MEAAVQEKGHLESSSAAIIQAGALRTPIWRVGKEAVRKKCKQTLGRNNLHELLPPGCRNGQRGARDGSGLLSPGNGGKQETLLTTLATAFRASGCVSPSA